MMKVWSIRITCFRSGKVSASPAKTRISLTLVELFSEHVPDTFRNRGTEKRRHEIWIPGRRCSSALEQEKINQLKDPRFAPRPGQTLRKTFLSEFHDNIIDWKQVIEHW